jgi:hypothetical protein
LALPVVLLAGCAGGGYYGYDGGSYYPGYYGGDYYGGGPVVDVGVYGSGRGYYHHDYHHYDSGNRTSVASRSSGSYHSGARVASASVSHASGHSGGGRTASVSASAGHGDRR